MNSLRLVLDVAADRGDGRRWCGLQLLAWTIAGPLATGALIALALCLAPASC